MALLSEGSEKAGEGISWFFHYRSTAPSTVLLHGRGEGKRLLPVAVRRSTLLSREALAAPVGAARWALPDAELGSCVAAHCSHCTVWGQRRPQPCVVEEQWPS